MAAVLGICSLLVALGLWTTSSSLASGFFPPLQVAPPQFLCWFLSSYCLSLCMHLAPLWISFILRTLHGSAHSVPWLSISSPDTFSLQACLLGCPFGIFPWMSNGHLKLNMPNNKFPISKPALPCVFPISINSMFTLNWSTQRPWSHP